MWHFQCIWMEHWRLQYMEVRLPQRRRDRYYVVIMAPPTPANLRIICGFNKEKEVEDLCDCIWECCQGMCCLEDVRSDVE